ncbi:MAG: hypothetical protein JNM36_11990 [Chitinophagales bacterium]|nr:hypothetical protein [Chitinophagales bacterium]
MQFFDVKKIRYDLDAILGHFGIQMGTDCPELQRLLDVSIASDYSLPPLLFEKSHKLKMEGMLWNEEELKMHFISAVFLLTDVEVPQKIKLFYERSLSAVVQDTTLNVVVDAMLAKPIALTLHKNLIFFCKSSKKAKKLLTMPKDKC